MDANETETDASVGSSLTKITKGAYYTFLGIAFGKLVGYFFKFITARIGVEQYGEISLALMIVNIFNIIILLGLDIGVVKFTAQYAGEKAFGRIKSMLKTLLMLLLPLSVAAAAILFFASDFIAIGFFKSPELAVLLKIVALSMPFEVGRTLILGFIRGFQNIKYIFYVKYVIEGSLRLLLAFILVTMGFGVFEVAAAYVAAIVLSALVSVLFLKRVFNLKDEKATQVNYKELFVYSWPLMFNSLIAIALLSVDSFMLGFFKNVTEVGIYNAVSPIARLTYMIPFAFSSLVMPVLAGIFASGDKAAFTKVSAATTKIVFKINLIILALVLVFPAQILGILFGQQYAAGALALVIQTCGFFIMYTLLPLREVLLVLNKTKLIFYLSLFALTLNIILNLLLIQPYGLLGAAIASGITTALSGILILTFAYKGMKDFRFDTDYIKIPALAVVCALAIKYGTSFLNTNSFIGLFIVSCIFVALYLIILILTKGFAPEEKLLLGKLFKRAGLKFGKARHSK